VRGTLSPGDCIISNDVRRLVPGQQVSLIQGSDPMPVFTIATHAVFRGDGLPPRRAWYAPLDRPGVRVGICTARSQDVGIQARCEAWIRGIDDGIRKGGKTLQQPDRTESQVRILGVSGSLRAASSNARLLLAASELLPTGSQLTLYTGLRDLPPFDPDESPDSHPAVAAWVSEVKLAEALVVSTPEYARGYPGALKNAFDWLVGTDAFVEKPFMLLSASSRSTVGLQTLTTVLETMSGIHIARASTSVPLLGTELTAAEIISHREFSTAIGAAMARFVPEIRDRRLSRT
jgi:chromate reductase